MVCHGRANSVHMQSSCEYTISSHVVRPLRDPFHGGYSVAQYTVVSRVSAHGCSTINPDFHHTGRLPGVLGAYSVQQLKEAGSIIMGVALAKYAHVRTCTLYIEHVCMIFRPSTRATKSLMLESWVKLLVRIRERIEIVDVRGSTTPDWSASSSLSSRSRGISSLIKLSSEPSTA